MFVKKKALDVSSATAPVAPELLKSLAILSDTTVRRSTVDREDLNYAGNQKKATFLNFISILIIYKFFKYLTNHRKKTNRALVFSCRHFRDILKYRDHQ